MRKISKVAIPAYTDILMVVVHMEIFVCAWGGFTVGPNISFSQAAGTDQDALSINITLTKALGTMTLSNDTDWLTILVIILCLQLRFCLKISMQRANRPRTLREPRSISWGTTIVTPSFLATI